MVMGNLCVDDDRAEDRNVLDKASPAPPPLKESAEEHPARRVAAPHSAAAEQRSTKDLIVWAGVAA